MTLSSPFIHNPFDWLPAEVPEFHRNREIIVLPHGGKEKRKASAAIGRLAESAVDAARRDHHVHVGARIQSIAAWMSPSVMAWQ
jgi:hypothetical protein